MATKPTDKKLPPWLQKGPPAGPAGKGKPAPGGFKPFTKKAARGK